MAEAHQAVAFSFSITHEGVRVNYDQEVLSLIWTSGLRSNKKRLARALNNAKNGIYPSSIEFLYGIIVFVLGSRFLLGIDPSFGFVDWTSKFIEPFFASGGVLVASVVYSIAIWFAKAMIMKYTLKALLSYHGWMFETRSARGVSLRTKVWLVLVKLLTSRTPLLYDYQGSLPRLSVPSVHNTLTRYLRSVRPLCDDEKYKRLERMADEFEKGIASRLQRYLILKSWWASNYVSDWWEEFVYLRGRSAIMVNSNYYAIDALLVHPTQIQAARAANLVYASLLFRRQIDRQELKPITLQNLVPLCSWQYERVFNTTRVPGLETDRIVHLSDSQHIAVICGGRFYKVDLYYRSKLLQPKQLESQFAKILEDKSEALAGEEHLAALTATDRVTWAQARQEYFRQGINRISLKAIEKAAFVVVFDDDSFLSDFGQSKNPEQELSSFGQNLLHGKGHDRWYDKSFNLVITKNARAGLNAEHSWADAPVMAHLWEYMLAYEDTQLGYDEKGNCTIGSELDLPAPQRLKWDLPQPLINTIEKSLESAGKLLNDVDLKLIMFTDYGKGFIKKCKLSPDAYIQLALQLAYYKDAGNLCLTYEASMVRLFREGRTETVRPVTIESAAWVKAMYDSTKTPDERRALARHASAIHQKGYQDAMTGKGVDRHLFCLYVISKYLEIDSPFLKEILSEPWMLSTSQTAHGQAGLIDLKKNPNHISAGGGFGPVADDGYGVSYMVAGEDTIFFHISSKRSSPKSDSARFARNLRHSLTEVKQLFEPVIN
ncbi:Carnitine O-palmitoyltransferase 1, liver isoform [Halotydeus destructor]|nr:Carnitine O-palmitoyltransferase 1, liver isoform [Halotydeus destructor]